MKYKSILITGGTGSFGKAFVKHLIKTNKNLKRLVIFSRDEWKQSEMAKDFPASKFPFIRFFPLTSHLAIILNKLLVARPIGCRIDFTITINNVIPARISKGPLVVL